MTSRLMIMVVVVVVVLFWEKFWIDTVGPVTIEFTASSLFMFRNFHLSIYDNISMHWLWKQLAAITSL